MDTVYEIHLYVFLERREKEAREEKLILY